MKNGDFLAKPVPLIPICFEHHAQIIFKNKPLTSFSFKLSILLLWSLFIQAKLRGQT